METVASIVGIFFIGLVAAVSLGVVTGFFVMILWNWTMPVVFGLQALTFFQAWCLCVICSLLFKQTVTVKK